MACDTPEVPPELDDPLPEELRPEEDPEPDEPWELPLPEPDDVPPLVAPPRAFVKAEAALVAGTSDSTSTGA